MNWIRISILILFTTITGTLVHELGHYMIAKMLNYNARVNYSSTDITSLNPIFKEMSDKYRNKKLDPDDDIIIKEITEDYFWIVISGPIITILFGCVGFVMLYFNKQEENSILNLYNLIGVSFALHWLRFPINFAITTYSLVFWGKNTSSDESKIALSYLFVDPLYVTIPLAIIGLAVLYYVFYRFYKQQLLNMFILTLIFAGFTSSILWFYILGPILLP